jgi:hypothetical protein
MSSKQFIRMGLMAGSGLAMMGLTACASGHSTTRYGGYDYEKGHNCGSACVAPAPVDAYAPVPVSPGPVYVDCTQIGTCGTMAPAPTTVYTAPTTTYVEPTTSYTTSTYSGEMADCPAGTSLQADGTCMQSGSGYSSYSSSTTYTAPTTTAVVCPSGTTMAADGSCLQTGYRSSGTTTSYRPLRK